ncbi:MAG: TonB-dependent receptor, partial [Polyangiaceae bacterium]
IGLDEASARLGLVHRASRAADPAGLVRLPAQTFLDLDLALAFLGHLALRMRLSNLLDQRTVDLIGYPLPGRAYHGLLETTW